MVQLFVKYKQTHEFGVIYSSDSNLTPNYIPLLETCEPYTSPFASQSNNAKITCLCEFNQTIAIGYSNGLITINTCDSSNTLQAHTSPNTAI